MEDYTDTAEELERRYQERRRYVADRKPYWLSLRHPRDGEMQCDLFNYFPDWHYRTAIDTLRETDRDGEVFSPASPGDGYDLEPDGGVPELHKGTTRSTVYYWLNPQTGAGLYHTEVHDDEANLFFDSVEEAESFLEQQAETADSAARYESMSLYKARTRKVRDAKDVLTDQAGIEDFVPDGGRAADPHQIPNPAPNQVWFWYNLSMDSIVQEEVEPYDVRGVFASEDDAERFLGWYADHYDVPDTSHLELYSAELQLEGYGRKHVMDEDDGEELPEQVDFNRFRSSSQDG